MNPQEQGQFKMNQPPKRPKTVVTWETRLEPELMATLLDFIEGCGITVRTKSELLRHAAYGLRDLLEARGHRLQYYGSLQAAFERLAVNGIVDLENMRSFSSRRSVFVEAALTSEDGYPKDVYGKVLKQLSREENKPPIYTDRALPPDDELIKILEFEEWKEKNAREVEEDAAQRRAQPQREETAEEKARREEVDRVSSLRRRYRKGIKLPECTGTQQDDWIAVENWRYKQGREPLGEVVTYLLCLEKGYDPKTIKDADEVFWEMREYVSPERASKYVDITKEPVRKELTKEERRAAMLAGAQAVLKEQQVD